MDRKVQKIIKNTHEAAMYNNLSEEFMDSYFIEIQALKTELSKDYYSFCAKEVNQLKAIPPNQIEKFYGKLGFWDRLYINSHMGNAFGTIFNVKQLHQRKYLFENVKMLELILAKLKSTKPNKRYM